VAYSAVALTIVSYPLLDKIEAMRLAPPPKPKSGGVTAELEAAAAAGAAAAAAALKGECTALPSHFAIQSCSAMAFNRCEEGGTLPPLQA
jgi:hypothetical protein